MKNPGHFRLWHTTLAIALAVTSSVYAQQAKPSSSVPTVNDEMAAMHAKAAKAPSTTLTVIFGGKTLTLRPHDLSDYPHHNVTVTNGHTKASETYSGVPISAILTKLGVPFEKASEHTMLKTYIIAEGTDGYRVLLSVYETLTDIRQSDVVVADAVITDGEFGPLDKDGAFKLVVPGDTRPQRWVQNLKSLTFKTIE